MGALERGELMNRTERIGGHGSEHAHAIISSRASSSIRSCTPRLPAHCTFLRTAPAKYAAHFAKVIESTWIVLVLVSSVPKTFTFCPANFSGVRWSLSV
jgi:hypothetical protein